MKRIVSIQDLSCVGKCSQTVALPVLSAMGLECAVLPTALLSAHTAFDGYVSRELTDCFPPILSHWSAQGLRFDTIYTGFLGSGAQIGAVMDVLASFPHALLFVDPAMGDEGGLYAGLAPDLPEQMRALCSRADFITPNVTEACLLTGTPVHMPRGQKEVRALLEQLLALGAKTAILTGIRAGDGVGVAALDRNGMFCAYDGKRCPAVKHGAGDLFAAVCVGALTLGMPPADAIGLAAEHVARTVRATAADSDARWYGLSFEATLPELMLRCRQWKEESR